MKDKLILGSVEEVTIKSKNSNKRVLARIDTGAKLSSMDTALVAELGLGPVVKTKNIKSSHGESLRPVVHADVVLKGRKIRAEFTFIDRSHMSYPVLIGRNILEQGFLVDASKE